MLENAIEKGLYNPDEKYVKIDQNDDNDLVVIDVPFGVSKKNLTELKSLIENFVGENPVQLNIYDSAGKPKKIKLRNKIAFDDGFKAKLKKILTI
jgi:hypothetical protein